MYLASISHPFPSIYAYDDVILIVCAVRYALDSSISFLVRAQSNYRQQSHHSQNSEENTFYWLITIDIIKSELLCGTHKSRIGSFKFISICTIYALSAWTFNRRTQQEKKEKKNSIFKRKRERVAYAVCLYTQIINNANRHIDNKMLMHKETDENVPGIVKIIHTRFYCASLSISAFLWYVDKD